ncbi:hypothetical protein [Paraburkholderia atlantica]|uniref:ABC-type sugar transport system permease subunit n=1 Tax=Paraburkholderia atlantica TaxID=2654982 RepID=A0A6I1Q2K5_PARAM|nr:hypothetical protein [Paraburkholderia atlantica]MBB5420644.1 ABC-type sugar transport system permease subunit [Paraburkholderia atlantica]MBB5428796.1 ABC-type sugar transport system permease subunit [Paraburkholderia atlantica]MPW08321.1 hypothetical protein [Paraburkholderia atlantica]NUY35623.1 hypothetical protein [Paraburkholderia atlantica]
MELIDRMVPFYRKFMALPFFARRAIIFVASVVIWIFGAKLASMHVNEQLTVPILLAGCAGALWSSEIWRLWKVFAVVVVICLAVLKS